MAAAAATTRRRREQRAEHTQRAARRSFVQKCDERRLRASAAFDRLTAASTPRGYLPDGKVEEFLEAGLRVAEAGLHPDAVRLVRNTAMKNEIEARNDAEAKEEGEKDGGEGKREGGLPENCYSKGAMMAAFEKYASYLRRRDEIAKIFSRFDRDGDDSLSRDELRKALQERENQGRAVKGLIVNIVVTYGDVDFILKNADADGTGTISRAEILPAIGAWEELAECRVEEMATRTGCLGVCTVM